MKQRSLFLVDHPPNGIFGTIDDYHYILISLCIVHHEAFENGFDIDMFEYHLIQFPSKHALGIYAL
jgi:hypothetical protein